MRFHGLARHGAVYNGNRQRKSNERKRPEMTMIEFAELCAEIAAEKRNYKKAVEFAVSDDKHYLVDNPKRRCPDLSYSEKKLNFKPTITTKEGIKRYIEFFDESEHDIKEDWNW